MIRLIALIIFLVSFDQFSKYFIRHYDFINDGFYICNSGISFGLKIPQNVLWFVYVLVFSAICYLIWQNYKEDNLSYQVILVIILSGASGNLIDRVVLGCVVDFIHLPFWPSFNLADVFIIVGAVYYIAVNVLEEK